MTILDRIVETKRQELCVSKANRSLDDLKAMIGSKSPPRDFYAAVLGGSGEKIRLIAEIKKASPSAGLIVPDFDPVKIAKIYHAHGAAALSVLTDETYFQGRLEFIEQVKEAVPLPVLRKDFTLEAYQLYEARAFGADAVLLIAEVLSTDLIQELVDTARSLGLAALVEVHTQQNLSAVLDRLGRPESSRYLLGINNRDLTAQRTDLTIMERLADHLPADTPFVAESGIKTHADIQRALAAGARAVLVGESLLKSNDIGASVDALLSDGLQ